MAELTRAGRQIRRFVSERGLTVLHGPLAGMVYPRSARGRASFLAAKILGSYELEIHDALVAVIDDPPAQIVDVGAGEGYYAVGLAMRTPPATEIVGFETDASGRRQCEEMAQLNGVADRITLRGSCDPKVLQSTLADGAFLLCDCEGYEFELLRPDLVPQLGGATIVAELHLFVRRDIEEVIQSRFSSTHQIRVMRMQARDRSSWPELSSWNDDEAFLVLSEGAPSPARIPEFERSWAYMTPRVQDSTG